MSKPRAHPYTYLTQKHRKACMSLWQKLLIKENCSSSLVLRYSEKFLWSVPITLPMQTTKYVFTGRLKLINVYCMRSETYVAFDDINGFNQSVGTKFCLLSIEGALLVKADPGKRRYRGLLSYTGSKGESYFIQTGEYRLTSLTAEERHCNGRWTDV